MTILRSLLARVAASLRNALPAQSRRGDEECGDAGRKTLIAPDLVLRGSMRSSGDVYLFGQVDGDVECDRIFFAGNGAVQGAVHARQQIHLDS